MADQPTNPNGQHPDPNKNLRPSAKNLRSSAPVLSGPRGQVEGFKKRHPNWGGRRPGAGAPKGNLNGLKHGMRSKQLTTLAAYLARDPHIAAIITAHAQRRGIQERRLEKLASRFLGGLVLRRVDLDEDEKENLRRVAMDMIDD